MSGGIKLAIIVGLPGVGKSTVLNLAKDILINKGYHVEVVNFGDYMFKYVVSQGLAKSRDEIRKLPLHVIRNLTPNTIIVVEAEPEEIVARQLRDRTRYRSDYAIIDLVKKLLSMNRMYAIASAVLVGASVNFIMNREGKANEAAEELVSVIERL